MQVRLTLICPHRTGFTPGNDEEIHTNMQVHKMKAIWEISIPVRRLTTWKRKWLN
jgi:hypothetical protein